MFIVQNVFDYSEFLEVNYILFCFSHLTFAPFIVHRVLIHLACEHKRRIRGKGGLVHQSMYVEQSLFGYILFCVHIQGTFIILSCP